MNTKTELIEILKKLDKRDSESKSYIDEIISRALYQIQELDKRPIAEFETIDLIEFNLPWPPSVNAMWESNIKKTRGRTYAEMNLTKRGASYRKNAAKELMVQRVPYQKITDRLSVTLYAYPPDKRTRDLDNLPKGILDAITYYEFWNDDEQIDELRIVRKPIVKFGLIKLVIKKIKLTR